MGQPKTAGELSQFVHCCRWLSLAIPDFARRIAPLVDVLEEAHQRSGRRTKKSIQGMDFTSLSWGTIQSEAFQNLQDTLRNSVELSYPDPKKEICVFIDASERFWLAIVTQCEREELEKGAMEQKHEPLAFSGAAFKKAKLNWTMFEKEGFAIFQAFYKPDYFLLSERPAHVFTDHRNLLFLFAPLALEPALDLHVVSKVRR